MEKACVIYCRVSTADQVGPGHHSLDAQEALCRKFAESQACRIVEVIRDEGYSGRTTQRPGLQRLLEYTGNKPPATIHAILVQDTSRVGRDATEHLIFRRQLRQKSIDLIAVVQPNIDGSPEGQLVDTILAAINQYQSDEKGRRVIIALEKKVRDGWWPGWAPLGYLNVDRGGNHVIVPDPERFPLVQLAFKWYATGRYSQDALQELLIEKGLTGRDGRPLPRVTLNQILANPFYCGILRWNGQEQTGKHQSATDRQTWERCQAVVAAHNRFAPRRRKHFFLLSGLTRCASCGFLHTHSIVAGKGNRYYHCSSRTGCKEPHIPAAELEAQALDALADVQLDDAFVERVIEKIRLSFRDREKEIAGGRVTLQRRKEALEQKRNVAEEKLLARALSNEAFQRINRSLTSQLDAIARQADELEGSRRLDTNALQEILEFARDIPQAYANAAPHLQQRYLGVFFKHFIVKERRIIQTQPTEFLLALQNAGSVRTKGNWLPGQELIRTVERMLDESEWLRETLGLSAA